MHTVSDNDNGHNVRPTPCITSTMLSLPPALSIDDEHLSEQLTPTDALRRCTTLLLGF
jgi:hypothetical protein